MNIVCTSHFLWVHFLDQGGYTFCRTIHDKLINHHTHLEALQPMGPYRSTGLYNERAGTRKNRPAPFAYEKQQARFRKEVFSVYMANQLNDAKQPRVWCVTSGKFHDPCDVQTAHIAPYNLGEATAVQFFAAASWNGRVFAGQKETLLLMMEWVLLD